MPPEGRHCPRVTPFRSAPRPGPRQGRAGQALAINRAESNSGPATTPQQPPRPWSSRVRVFRPTSLARVGSIARRAQAELPSALRPDTPPRALQFRHSAAVPSTAGCRTPARSPNRGAALPHAAAGAAIRLGRDYLLAHAQAAFGVMGTSQVVADARGTLAALRELGNSVISVNSVTGGSLLEISRRDLHARVFGGQRT